MSPHVSIQAVLVSRAPPHDLDPCDVKYLCAIKTVSNSVTGDSVATLSHVMQRARPCSKHTFNLCSRYEGFPVNFAMHSIFTLC